MTERKTIRTVLSLRSRLFAVSSVNGFKSHLCMEDPSNSHHTLLQPGHWQKYPFRVAMPTDSIHPSF